MNVPDLMAVLLMLLLGLVLSVGVCAALLARRVIRGRSFKSILLDQVTSKQRPFAFTRCPWFAEHPVAGWVRGSAIAKRGLVLWSKPPEHRSVPVSGRIASRAIETAIRRW